MGHKTRAALLVAGLVCVTDLSVWGQEPKNSAPPEWRPAQAQLSKLNAEVKIDDWAIRPPKDSVVQTNEGDKERRERWTLPRTATVLMLRVGRGTSGSLPPDAYAETFMNRIKNPPKGMVLSAPEKGTINGKLFMRARYSLELPPNSPSQTKMIFGFIYVSEGGDHPVMIDGFGPASDVETVEASALTFHFVKAEATAK